MIESFRVNLPGLRVNLPGLKLPADELAIGEHTYQPRPSLATK